MSFDLSRPLHSWNLSPKEAIELQQKLRSQIVPHGLVESIRWIAGVDVAYDRRLGLARAAAVVCRWPDMKLVDSQKAEARVSFPYVPGLLSFREAPVALEALSGLSYSFDCLLVDGHGLAHPRRFGIACHLGLWSDSPTIGCAKSKLYGQLAQPPGPKRGSWSALTDSDGTLLGAALTTKDRCSPVFVSVGHKVDLERAIEIVLACCLLTKHPEPLRLAHKLSAF